ncbi:Spo0B domain-containing protein [Salirhabdus salicampi]|uniref:Spo0B domain-containing protein n=1 Tax=Salirhabdus salicampi TaxID=476102 RepID=UPI0020C24E3D|nr:Spo0B domain-containing protein [Salirhabdus salicampi]MCP8617002.1 sporulation initiation phosphotransferase B [Salirhabdus salicampi]
MERKEVIDVINHYRHDVLNDIQLVKGYASMGKLDKVNDIVTTIIHKAHEERKLTRLQCPHFFLWLLQFNWTYNQFQIQYQVSEQVDPLTEKDIGICDAFEQLISTLEAHVKADQLYEGMIIIEEKGNINVTFTGSFVNITECHQHLDKINFVQDVHVTEEKCNVTFSFQKELVNK